MNGLLGGANFNVDTAKFICQTNLRQQDTIPKTCCPFLIGAYINACLGAAGQEGRNEFVAFRSGCDTLLASVINVGDGTTQIAAEGASDVYNGQNFSRTGYIDTLNSRAGCNIFSPLAGGKIPPNSTVISLYSNVDFPYNFSDLCPNTCAPIYVILGA
ncbi:MAG: hypothetical protein IPJ43_20565 [Saprospiraceae bacterium]|nr:hypothetical protein [Saprospiraceae bacterium]